MGRLVRQTFGVPESEFDRLLGWLFAHGATGLEQIDGSSRTAVEAYFAVDRLPGKSDLERLREWCPGVVCGKRKEIPEFPLRLVGVPPRGPILLGERLVVDPREPGEAQAEPRSGSATAGRRLLRIPARTAFGVGSHASTRLAYELLEPLDLSGRRVLDVGTGTGILAFGARFAGAARVTAFDLDPGAALLAAQYGRANRVDVGIFAGSVAALAGSALFDLVLANLLPNEFAPIREELAARTAERGEWILSGLLLEHERDAIAACGPLGFEVLARRDDGEWVALRLGRLPRAA